MILCPSQASCLRQQRYAHGHDDKDDHQAQAGRASQGHQAPGEDGGAADDSGARHAQALTSPASEPSERVVPGTWQEAGSNAGFFHFGGGMIADAGCAPDKVSPRATCVAHAWLRQPIYDELKFAASRRREHPDILAAKLVTAVLLLGVADELIEKAEKLLQIR